MKNNSIMKKILRAFFLVCFVSLMVNGVTMLILMTNIRSLTLESGNNIGSTAADNGKESLVDQTLSYSTILVQESSNYLNLELKTMAETVAVLKDYVELIYSNRETLRPVRIPNMRQVPPGELKMHWFFEPGIITGTSYPEADLARSGLLDETYLLGNMERMIEPIMKNMSNISSIYILTKSGQNIHYDTNASIKAGLPGHIRFQERPWYKNARDKNGLYISEIYLNFDMADMGWIISTSMPFYDTKGEFLGVVGIDVEIDDADEGVQETEMGDTDYTLLINNSAGEGQNESKIIFPPGLFNEKNKNNIAAFLGGNTEGILADMKAIPRGHGYSSFKSGEEERGVYVIWAPLEITNWQIAYVVPEKDILASATALYDEITRMTADTVKQVDSFTYKVILISGLLMLVIIFLTVWAARFIAGRIARPIAALTGSVQKIGDGNLDYHSEIRTGDEIEELSLSFEHMTVELKGYIENLHRVTAEKERIGAELNIATKIQASMLPRIFPPFPNRKEFDIYASMLPAKEVGGDFFDFFLIDKDTLAVVIADVSGKGVPAALFMVIAKTLIKNNAQHGLRPREVFEIVNNLLCKDNEEDMFVTAFMGFLDIPSGRFTCVNAGHNPPLIKRGDKFGWYRTKRGLVLGAMEDMFYKEEETVFRPGDILYLYTDGVTEAVNPQNELFGDDRLMEAAQSSWGTDMQEFTYFVKQKIDVFADGAEQADDITMLVLKYRGDKERELQIEARQENLDVALDFVNEELEKMQCSSKIQSQIDIAVEEIFVNIAHYAYNPETGIVIIRIAASNDEIRFEFEDTGKPYNPLEKADPDITIQTEDRPIGGLGVFMVKKIMDSVEYRYEGSKNLLTLRKTII
jgi:sigma-B regulation protein RsbU (phosphoserine phosphatase)